MKDFEDDEELYEAPPEEEEVEEEEVEETSSDSLIDTLDTLFGSDDDEGDPEKDPEEPPDDDNSPEAPSKDDPGSEDGQDGESGEGEGLEDETPETTDPEDDLDPSDDPTKDGLDNPDGGADIDPVNGDDDIDLFDFKNPDSPMEPKTPGNTPDPTGGAGGDLANSAGNAAGDVAGNIAENAAGAAETVAGDLANAAADLAEKAAEGTAKAAAAGSKGSSFFGGGLIKAIIDFFVATWPYGAIVVGAIILLIIVIIVVIILVNIAIGVVGFVNQKTDPTYMVRNEYVTSRYFYGLRTVYVDDDALSESLYLSYKQYNVAILSTLDDHEAISINISLPDTVYADTTLDDNIINMSLALGNIVANNIADYSVSFADLYPSISYFGITQEQSATFNSFLNDYLVSNNIVDIEGEVSLEEALQSTTSSESLLYMYNICEKVMIKDEIALSDGISGLAQRKYIASIYMPKKDISISDLTYTIASDASDLQGNVKLIHVNGGPGTILMDTTVEESPTLDSPSRNPEILLPEFTSINPDETDLYKDGVSLFDAVRMCPTETQYFTKSDEGIYTWLPVDSNLLYLTFDIDNTFIFNEFAMNVK